LGIISNEETTKFERKKMSLGDYLQTADWKSEKHAPVIECPDTVNADEEFHVSLTIGKEIPHPNTRSITSHGSRYTSNQKVGNFLLK
jgi:desulfoferrodoxin (superoxide reductase-like protein)